MPIEQVGNAVTFPAFYTNNGLGATGLTVTVDVWEIQADGTSTKIVSAGSATEVGGGAYRYVLAAGSVDEIGEYVAIFMTAGTVDQAHIASSWTIGRAGIENLDAVISSRGTEAKQDIIDTNVDAILLDTGTDGVAISQAVRQAIADEILSRGIANVEDAADATSLATLVLAAFESVIVGALWTIYKTDHSTTFTTKPVVTSPAADPIVEVG